ncbi:Cytochrome P450 [Saccharopolyspora antimicrobica]|uniref:Cytochrome P450 n=1 Tax=Saccharopolyspora antimicrobica TaxID=455193 RepID=A0A1I4VGL1_9PSEU|nr:cytochrome P450 [Saccharopolyspora antimicrobica]RKT86292.1 cytochrome P450 [Saccharopolyspora antimicrobica]SFN00233.1 Cytochrome P450 [Saccharopolyspora antimicrobica]
MRATESELPEFPFTTADGSSDRERVFRLREEQPISRVVLSGVPVWLVTRHADVNAVLVDTRFSLARAIDPGIPRLGTVEMMPGQLLATDPPEHTRLRKLVTKVFTARRIEQLRPHVQDVSDRLLDRLAGLTPPVDLIEHFAAALPIEIICEMLGVPHQDRDRFQDWTERILTVSGLPDEEVRSGWARMTGYLAGLVSEKRRAPTDDLLGMLTAARDEDDELTEDELVLLALALLIGGYETTKNQLASSVAMLLTEHPDQWQRLIEHPELIPSAVEELLRYVPLFGYEVTFPRVATATVELGGVTIAAGDTVLISLTSANRDSAVFDAPDEFDPARLPNRHLAFGNGVHRCLGAQLARIELETGLGGLLRRFPQLRLTDDELQWKKGVFVHALHRLQVEW